MAISTPRLLVEELHTGIYFLKEREQASSCQKKARAGDMKYINFYILHSKHLIRLWLMRLQQNRICSFWIFRMRAHTLFLLLSIILRKRVRWRTFLVRMRNKLKVKIRSILTYKDFKPPKGCELFTMKGVEWLRSVSGVNESILSVDIMSTTRRIFGKH